ncbi:MAG TPA: alpha-amylase/4-alpha-glucanotransferase domain-containing protein [Actinomycetota bacterium]|nr:alpha-amylase/4-alpha-glucanotransferase domain-containing protein [Actinomycetota bacterium]
MPKLALVVHFHQPVGNLDSVVANATDRCYRPFLEVVRRHPGVKLTLHYSGCLLEWLESNAADVTEMLGELVAGDRVELLTGGFYEPILAALPRRDQVGQIRMLTDHLRGRYRFEPKGLWLTERVWEPELAATLADAGVEYTVLDDTMFHAVGIEDAQLTGAFVTEYDGRPVRIFAGDRQLRYLIPYKRVERVVDYLTTQAGATDHERVFVYGDDGEKFGEWPDTYERVYEKGWLEDFFTALASSSIETMHLQEAAMREPVGRVYLPSSAYDELMVWALPTEARLRLGGLRRALGENDPKGTLPFLKGAPWRAFLAKYPEINRLQKRMLHVSKQVDEIGDDLAKSALYRAQCNCSYWHGSFGGVYLPFMRSALWHHLLRAEASAQRARPGPTIEVADLDADGQPEILMRASWGTAVISPRRGGALVELGDWGVGANLLAVMSRHREAYHVEDENPETESEAGEMQASQARGALDRSALEFDEEERLALIDWLDERPIVDAYEYEVEADSLVRLTREEDPVRIVKQLSADADELISLHIVTNTSAERYAGSYGVEISVLPLNLGREAAEDTVESDDYGWTIYQPEGEVGLSLTSSLPMKLETEAIATIAATLEGLKPMRQGTTLRMKWPLDLAPEEAFRVELRWRPQVRAQAEDKLNPGVSA